MFILNESCLTVFNLLLRTGVTTPKGLFYLNQRYLNGKNLHQQQDFGVEAVLPQLLQFILKRISQGNNFCKTGKSNKALIKIMKLN